MRAVPIVLGTEVFSGDWGVTFSQKAVDNILQFAFLNGVNEIDTAPSYGSGRLVERMIGDATAGARDRYVIASKFRDNHSGDRAGTPIRALSEIQRELEDTLRALRTTYLDIYYFHSGRDDAFFQDEIWAWLNDQVRHGTIRALGLSLSHGLVIAESYGQLMAARQYGISVVQTVLNLYSQQSLKFVVPYSQEQGLTVYGRMPLAKGLLSGKYTTSTVFPEGDPRGRDRETSTSILTYAEKQPQPISVEHAIQWSLSHADKIVVGAKHVNQLAGTIASATAPPAEIRDC